MHSSANRGALYAIPTDCSDGGCAYRTWRNQYYRRLAPPHPLIRATEYVRTARQDKTSIDAKVAGQKAGWLRTYV